MTLPITDTIVRAAKERQLKEARDAYHSLATGTMARVIVDQNGERVEFNPANQAKLSAYIMDLESQLGQSCAGALFAVRPVMFTF